MFDFLTCAFDIYFVLGAGEIHIWEAHKKFKLARDFSGKLNVREGALPVARGCRAKAAEKAFGLSDEVRPCGRGEERQRDAEGDR